VKEFASDQIVPIREYECLYLDRIVDCAFDRKPASIDFRYDTFDDDPLSTFSR
jgi:hypothetical protein